MKLGLSATLTVIKLGLVKLSEKINGHILVNTLHAER